MLSAFSPARSVHAPPHIDDVTVTALVITDRQWRFRLESRTYRISPLQRLQVTHPSFVFQRYLAHGRETVVRTAALSMQRYGCCIPCTTQTVLPTRPLVSALGSTLTRCLVFSQQIRRFNYAAPPT